jgi:hypothetical protein
MNQGYKGIAETWNQISSLDSRWNCQFQERLQGKTQGHDFLQFLSVMKSSKQDYLDSIDALKEGKLV